MSATATAGATSGQFLTTEEAARFLRLSRQTLARWRCEGSPIPFSRLGSRIVYARDDLDAFVISQKRTSTSQRR